jgi:hypothetical protein
VSANQGDHVLVYTKDAQKLDLIVTEINSERKILIGRPISQPKYSYYKPIAVNFSDIEGIETKQSKPPNQDDDLDEPNGFPSTDIEPVNKWELVKEMWTWENLGDAFIAFSCVLGPFCW